MACGIAITQDAGGRQHRGMGAGAGDILRASRLSNPIEALIASMIASGPAAKRPPHMALAVLSVMRSGPLEEYA
jgi:hypothetical protein